MKFEEFEQKYGGNVDGLFLDRDVAITNVICGTATPVVELLDMDSDTALPPLRIWDNDVLIGLLQTADEQGALDFDLDAIDIDPDNLDETIRLLVGCTLQMPVRLDHLQP